MHFIKKTLIIWGTIAFLNTPVDTFAVSAYPDSLTITQPDGSKLTVFVRGDENSHYYTTPDKFTIIRNKSGFFTYAVRDKDGKLQPGSMRVQNINKRTQEEQDYIRKTGKMLPTINLNQKEIRNNALSTNFTGLRKIKTGEARLRSQSAIVPRYLILLVNFKDKSFVKSNTDFNNLLNQTGYNQNSATGSVKDFYSDNSMGNFSPQFDVFGPVTLDNTMAYYGKNNDKDNDVRPREMILDACAKAKSSYGSTLNFADYDLDKDGYVDNVYVFFAEYSEAAGGADSTIWPHQWSVTGAVGINTYDGVKIGSYACSSELKGNSGANMDGIGTFCHEFGHVLGLPDLYDTDYEDNGTVFHPGSFDLMASGNYNNSSRTPPCLSLFEREILGWTSSTLLDQYTSVENLKHLAIGNSGYFYSTNPAPVVADSPSEWFYIENRQQTGWDKYLPAHGLMITHVDMSDDAITKYWNEGLANAYATHPCYEILKADGVASIDTRSGDLFTGNGSRNYLNDEGLPNTISWNGYPTQKPLSQIKENADGTVSFKFMESSTSSSVYTLPAEAITAVSATLKASVVNGTPSRTGFCWSSNPIPLKENEFAYTSVINNNYTLYLSNITPGSILYYRSFCEDSNGLVFYGNIRAIETDCLINKFPYSEGFSNWKGANPVCYKLIDNNSDNLGWKKINYSKSGVSNTGLYCKGNATLAADDYIITPQFEINAGASNVKMDFVAARFTGAVATQTIQIFVSATTREINAFTHQLGQYTLKSGISGGTFSVTLPTQYIGQKVYFAFKCTSAANSEGLLFDDISITGTKLATAIIDPMDKFNPKAYMLDKDIVQITNLSNENNTIEIFDISGRLLNRTNNSTTRAKISIQQKGLLIIHIKDASGEFRSIKLMNN